MSRELNRASAELRSVLVQWAGMHIHFSVEEHIQKVIEAAKEAGAAVERETARRCMK